MPYGDYEVWERNNSEWKTGHEWTKLFEVYGINFCDSEKTVPLFAIIAVPFSFFVAQKWQKLGIISVNKLCRTYVCV